MILRTSAGYILDNSSGDLMDCAMRTGVMALSGSKQDQELLKSFEISPGILVRCPEKRWAETNPNNFTRDQLVPFMAGCYEAKEIELARRVFYRHLFRFGFCQNTERDYPGSGPKIPDWCDPGVMYHLAFCARSVWALPLAIIGVPWLCMAILYNCIIKPYDEQNQIYSICIVQGGDLLWLYKILHEKGLFSIEDYWRGWRNQPEIFEAISQRAQKELL